MKRENTAVTVREGSISLPPEEQFFGTEMISKDPFTILNIRIKESMPPFTQKRWLLTAESG